MIADRLDRLALAMLEAPGDARRTALAAAELGALAAQVRHMEEAVVPPHLRYPEPELPDGVAAIWKHGRWIERRAPR